MRPGDTCIFDRNTYHRSVRNDTDLDRYAYAAQYLAENTRLAETGKKDPKRMQASDLRRLWRREIFLRSPTEEAVRIVPFLRAVQVEALQPSLLPAGRTYGRAETAEQRR